jgi:hypothetical protein
MLGIKHYSNSVYRFPVTANQRLVNATLNAPAFGGNAALIERLKARLELKGFHPTLLKGDPLITSAVCSEVHINRELVRSELDHLSLFIRINRNNADVLANLAKARIPEIRELLLTAIKPSNRLLVRIAMADNDKPMKGLIDQIAERALRRIPEKDQYLYPELQNSNCARVRELYWQIQHKQGFWISK